MLREIADAAFVRDGRLVRRIDVRLGRQVVRTRFSRRVYRGLLADAQDGPVLLFRDAARARQHWLLGERFWWDDEDLAPRDVLALVHQRDLRRERRLAAAHADLTAERGGAARRREPVPRAVREVVFVRDGGACVTCGSRFDLQYDHVLPVARGGATTAENLQVLCAPCNRAKGAAL